MNKERTIVLLSLILLVLVVIIAFRFNESWNTPTPSPSLVVTTPTSEVPESASLTLLSPNGAEKLCRGEEVMLRWQGPGDITSISFYLHKRGESSDDVFLVGTFPVSFSEEDEHVGIGTVSWKAGLISSGVETMTTYAEFGDQYEILATSEYKENTLGDVSDGVFTISNCIDSKSN